MYTNNNHLISRYELDKFILSRLSSLSASQLVEAIQVFTHSDFVEVHEAIEVHLITNMDLMEMVAATELLYFLG